MIAPDQSKAKMGRVDGAPSRTPELPFRIELWDGERTKVERVVARACSANLAHAIFRAACEQYPDRHLTLWRGRERLAEKS
jgi:uncharacterized Zn finger protein